MDVGLDQELEDHKQIVLLDGDYQIDDELSLFIVETRDKCHSEANDSLFAEANRDDFTHEQNLIIHGQKNILVMGCGHTGVVNIMEKAEQYQPELCIGGYHLFNPATRKVVSAEILGRIATELGKYSGTTFYTCHCTGKKAYQFLSQRLSNMHYLSCGETIEVE